MSGRGPIASDESFYPEKANYDGSGNPGKFVVVVVEKANAHRGGTSHVPDLLLFSRPNPPSPVSGLK